MQNTHITLLTAGFWPAVAINDNRSYNPMKEHNDKHHNADKIRAAVEMYNNIIASAAATGAAAHRSNAWTHKKMMFVALAMVSGTLYERISIF
jgi:hypothetical protein